MADAQASAAAAPPAKPAAPPPTPSGKAPQTFDVRLALAKNLGVPLGAEPPKPAATTAKDGNIDADPAADESAEATEAEAPADGEAAEAEGDAGEAPGEGEELTAEARLEAAAKAFEAGDAEAIGKALGKAGQPLHGPLRRAFRVFNRRTKQLDDREKALEGKELDFTAAKTRAQQEIANESRILSQQQRQLGQKYGWAHQLQEAWENEDMLAVGKALERGCKGATLATITQKLATGKTGKSAEERALADERKRFEEERAAEARKKAEAEDGKTRAQQREAAVTRIGEALKAHPYLETVNAKGEKGIDTEALAEVFNAYEASWNGEKFTKTARQCADELQEKLLARAKARGLSPATAPAPKAPAAAAGKTPPKKTPSQKTGMREPPRMQTPARGTQADYDATRANRLAQARRLTEMQRRGVR